MVRLSAGMTAKANKVLTTFSDIKLMTSWQTPPQVISPVFLLVFTCNIISNVIDNRFLKRYTLLWTVLVFPIWQAEVQVNRY